MSPLVPVAVSQASFAAAVLLATAGTYVAISPPHPWHPSPGTAPKTGDTLRWLHQNTRHLPKLEIAPMTVLALHTSLLALSYPNIPASVLRHGAANGLNMDLVTWSPATALPLALVLCVGVPLRLAAYSALGKNFTFALAEPDRLKTDGIYRYIQHPSYTAMPLIILGDMALAMRMDGALSCWVPPQLYPAMRTLLWMFWPVSLSIALSMIWVRVRQEEKMLHAKFGPQWEKWHATTARFVPWLF